MHHAQAYIDSAFATANSVSRLSASVLNAVSAAGLARSLRADAIDYCYSGAISIADGVRGIDAQLYSWATVKLYYATFYLARAMLAVNGVAVLYRHHSPFSWRAMAGEMPGRLSGNTHNVVLNLFQSQASFAKFHSQPVAGVPVLHWLRERRDIANYRNSRFEEPLVPGHFSIVSNSGVRKAVESYVSDVQLVYAFDEDHAALAFPIELMKATILEINALLPAGRFGEVERGYISSLFKDSRGPIPGIARLLAVT